MTYQDIEALTIKKEGNSLEFKESTGQLDRSMETLCAFLNGEGGTILYGVKDDGKIIGQTVSDSTKRSIAEAVNRIEPFVDLEITYVAIPGTENMSLSFLLRSNVLCVLSHTKEEFISELKAPQPSCHRNGTITY